MAQIKQKLPTHICTVTNKFHNTPVHKHVRMSGNCGDERAFKAIQGGKAKRTEKETRAINQKASRIWMVRKSDPPAPVL